MPASPGLELTVAEMTAAIREQLAGRSAGNAARRESSVEDLPPAFLDPRVDWHQLLSGVKQAEEHAHVGRTVPALRRLPPPIRQLARLIARVLLLGTRFITNRQRSFNQSALGTLNNLFGLMRYLEQVNGENQRRLEIELKRLHARLDYLEGRDTELPGRARPLD